MKNDLISRAAAIDAVRAYATIWMEYTHDMTPDEIARKALTNAKATMIQICEELPAAQPEITDEQAIKHLQSTGWMQNHDRRMYEMGLKEQLADDSGSYDSLMPAAQPEQQWIPCSERLPEDDTDVIITYRYKDGEGDTSHAYIDITSYGDMYFGGNPVHDVFGKIKHWRQPFAYFTNNYEVIAWMPLPEPYQEDDE